MPVCLAFDNFVSTNKYGFAPYEVYKVLRDKTFTYRNDLKSIQKKFIHFNICAVMPTVFLSLTLVYAILSITYGSIAINTVHKDTHILTFDTSIGYNVYLNKSTNQYESSMNWASITLLAMNALALLFIPFGFMQKNKLLNHDQYVNQPYYARYLEIVAQKQKPNEKKAKWFEIGSYIAYAALVLVIIFNITLIALPIDVNSVFEDKIDLAWYLSYSVESYKSGDSVTIINTGMIVLSIVSIVLEITSIGLFAQISNDKNLPLMAAILDAYKIEKQPKIVVDHNDNDLQQD